MKDPDKLIRIATRRSRLALWQAEHVRGELGKAFPDFVIELVPIITQGDRILDTPLAALGGKGLFIKELEVALLEGRADLAVHSMKDVPADIPAALHIPAVLRREDPRDVLLSRKYAAFDKLPERGRVGTSSLRRKSQLLAMRPDLVIDDLRGNVTTRLERLDAGDFDAIVLAAAGIKRLGLLDSATTWFETHELIPAAGQGVIGIEIRRDDERLRTLLAELHDQKTFDCVTAERAMNALLQGGCQAPIGGYAEIDEAHLRIEGIVASLDGKRTARATVSGPDTDPVAVGRRLAEQLIERGAAEIIAALSA